MRTAMAAFILVICSAAWSGGRLSAGEETALSFTMATIDGEERSLEDYRGKVLLIVNTASRCGLTPQYKGLQAVYDRYRERGFEVLAFPANNFLGQEPGTDAQIKDFCFRTYQTTFPLFSKISVAGEDIHPLYAYLTQRTEFSGPIAWNFTKFLVGRDGRVMGRFEPKTAPESPQVLESIERALDAP